MWELIKDIPYKMIVAIDKIVKGFTKKYLVIIIFIILSIFLIFLPYLFERYLSKDFMENADRLSYYGAIFGSFVAITGVYLTLNHNHKVVAEERRKSVLPIITIAVKDDSKVQQEIKSFGSVENVNSYKFKFEAPNLSNDENDNLSKIFYLRNSGSSSAINFNAFLYCDNMKISVTRPYTIVNGERVALGISLNDNGHVGGEYYLVITYYDIYMNGYEQKHILIGDKDNSISLGAIINQKQI